MGTWGSKILDDDFAVEVSERFIELLYEGMDSETATTHLVSENNITDSDTDEKSIFWLSLAHTQYEYGRLVENVKVQALEVIASGEDIVKWNGDVRRTKALNKLKSQLIGEQKNEKKLTRRVPKLKEGDFFLFPIGNSMWGYGRVLDSIHRAFYKFHTKEKTKDLDVIQPNGIAFVVGSTDDEFASRKWKIIGNRPLEERLKQPILFFHQAVGSDECLVFDIWKMHLQRPVHESECIGMEQWGSWSGIHILERLNCVFENKPSVYEKMFVKTTCA